ncbi:hypothetical protein [Nitrosomonas sp.]|uniref:hypothetical protein n=1 Tax=Nitrosomonas sp. TaxID=42353 RepID=UPI001E16A65C|nr:hypothetical protein [Nitrosomonas sp.]MCB1950063.1 hypothetical protein [Nitrosomonas sp.]
METWPDFEIHDDRSLQQVETIARIEHHLDAFYAQLAYDIYTLIFNEYRIN